MLDNDAKDELILDVAINIPIRRNFEYLHLQAKEKLTPGVRVQIPFAAATKVGVLVSCSECSTFDKSKLKRIIKVIDQSPLFFGELLDLLYWVAGYYQYPVGEVIFNALPVMLRQGQSTDLQSIKCYTISALGKSINTQTIKRAPRQAHLLKILTEHNNGLSDLQLNECVDTWREPMKRLVAKGWVEISSVEYQPAIENVACEVDALPILNLRQQQAIDEVVRQGTHFSVHLLEGVTGSGKTEVYLRIIRETVHQKNQVLVLVPEIALTPQLIERFRSRFRTSIVALHSGLSDRERLNAWLLAKQGKAKIIIGTRSAVFTPFEQLGLVIVDEEHDSSFKQQEGFRYSARDVAVRRAQQLDIPIILGSATPSLETLHNVETKKYQHLVLPERAGAAVHPEIRVLDMRGKAMKEGLSITLINNMRKHLDAGNQVILFLNRRGFAPTLLCHECGWVADCKRCDSHMTLHLARNRLRCHHCGSERLVDKVCPQCDTGELVPIGLGTERIEQLLQQLFADTPVVRIDRDTTRRKGSLEKKLAEVHQGDAKILLGTQMLAKGHHFPNVTLVGIIDVDQGLFSADFRAIERMAQLVVQVAGRAGRAEKPGEVFIQTHQPQHPLLQILIKQGYGAFAKQTLMERKAAELPPFSYLALLRAEAVDSKLPYLFLEEAKNLAGLYSIKEVQIQGPVPALMEKRAGRFRAQLLLQAKHRGELHRLLTPWVLKLEELKSGRKVRWSIDIDPIDMY